VSDCVFCRIVSGDEPAQILWGGHYAHRALVIVPLGPVVEGHVIALPKVHADDFTGNWQATADAMHAAFQHARSVGGDMNLITSKGLAATQSVFHLHVHLVPRKANDGLALPWHSGKSKRAVSE
jgi:histidine triad (HIT) family protein